MAKKDRPKDSRSDASNRIVYPWREVFLYWSVALLNDGLAHGNSGFFRLGIGQYLLLSKLPVSKCRSSLEAGPEEVNVPHVRVRRRDGFLAQQVPDAL